MVDRLPLPVSVFLHCPWLFQLGIFCEEHMMAGRPQKANTSGSAGGGLLSAPDFCIFALSPALQSGDFLRRTHVGSHARKRQTPRAAQVAARLTSLISASSCGPADRENFCGQCAPDSRIWMAAVTSAEMVYHRAALPLAEAGASAGSATVRRDFCIEKGQARKPVLFESMGKRSINSWLRGSGRMPWDVHIRGKPREPSRPRGCSRSWSTAIQPSRSWQILRPSLR